MDNSAESREIVIERVFRAPAGQVWEAWTDPAKWGQWWAKDGFTMPLLKMEPKTGAEYLYCLRSPEGKNYWYQGVVIDTVPASRLAATDLGSIITLNLAETEQDITKLTLRYSNSRIDEIEQASALLNQSLDRLDRYLARRVPAAAIA